MEKATQRDKFLLSSNLNSESSIFQTSVLTIPSHAQGFSSDGMVWFNGVVIAAQCTATF